MPIVVVSGERDRPPPWSCWTWARTTTSASPSGPTSCWRGSAPSPVGPSQTPEACRGGRCRGGGAQTGWELDRRRHEIRWRGTVVPATVTEFRLLRELVERLGEVVSHDDLLKAGWPDVPDPDPLWLKPHLARLREKLVNAGAPIPVAVRGVGYLLEDHTRDRLEIRWTTARVPPASSVRHSQPNRDRTGPRARTPLRRR